MEILTVCCSLVRSSLTKREGQFGRLITVMHVAAGSSRYDGRTEHPAKARAIHQDQ